MLPDRTNLVATSFVYEALVAQLGRHRNLEPARLVDEVERVATFAYRHHPGVFADGRVENVLLDFNDEVAKTDSSNLEMDCFTGGNRPRLLHVASSVNQMTGNSRVLARWVDRDLASEHCVVLTRQGGAMAPILADACRQRAVKIVNLPNAMSKLGRAAVLRKLASQADRIILHHDREDAIPVLAFAASGGPPVVYFNHSHFWFSLGGTVADITLNTLPFFRRHTERFRFPRATDLISGVAQNREYVPFDKRQAKQDLGLDPDLPVLLTIGSEHYFRPAHGQDFFTTLQKVLAACGPLQVLVIGPRPDADFVPSAITRNKCVWVLGPVSDPVHHYHAADLCLESFPHPSLGGFVEAVAYGAAFPIPAYGPGESILRVDMPPLSQVSPRAENETQYMAGIAERLAHLPQTLATARELQTTLWNMDREWPSLLQKIYARVDGLSHTPGPIPEARCSFEPDNETLAALKPFHLPSEIHAWFPYMAGTKLNFKSVLQGVGSIREALAYEGRHLGQGFLRRWERNKRG